MKGGVLMVENLRSLRKARGMSQQQLADAIGVTQQAIHQYENNKIEPDIENLKRLADALSTSVDYLINHRPSTQESYTIISEEEMSLLEYYRCMSVADKRFVKKLLTKLKP